MNTNTPLANTAAISLGAGLSARQDAWIRRTSYAATATVALGALVMSYAALRSLAEQEGISESTSWMLPVIIDGSILSAFATVLSAALRGERAIFSNLVIAFSSLLSIAGNVANGGLGSIMGGIVHSTPPVMLILAIHGSMVVTKKRLALSAIHAAAEAEAEAKALAKTERERAASERAAEKERIANEKAAEAKVKQEQRKAANAVVERAIGKTPKRESPGAQAVRDYAATIEGFSDLPLARRTALLSSALGASSADIIDSGMVKGSDDEERSVTARRVYKSLSRAAARTQGENAPAGPRRLNVA